MESTNELKKIYINNRTCYYFDNIMEVDEYINIDRILLDEKSYKKTYENILIHEISYKTFVGEKPLSIRFNKVNGLIKIYNGIRYLELFDSYNEFYYRNISKIYNAFSDWIKYLISEKSGFTEIVLIIILEKSELIHIILHL